jgi:hypothetical protein
MNWTTQQPNVFGSIEAVLSRFRTEGCRALAEGYQALMEQGAGEIPAKNGLDISKIVPAIPHLVLAAVTKPDQCIYRLAGEALMTRIGVNPKGRNYYEFVPKERFAHASHAMHMVIDQPSAFRAEISQQYSDGRVWMIEVLAVPLTSEDPEVDGFILFADCEINRQISALAPERRLVGANILVRDLIDLGYGVDANFVDRVLVN